LKSFHFRLENLLRLRRAREDALLAELAAARRALEHEKELLHRLRLQERQAIASSSDRRQKPGDLFAERNFGWYLETLRERSQQQRERVEAAHVTADAKLAEAIEAMKARKVLEKLKEQRREQYDRAEAREQLNALDEFSALSIARRHAA